MTRQELGVNQTLYFLVFGESLLNDAVTVVLYNILLQLRKIETVRLLFNADQAGFVNASHIGLEKIASWNATSTDEGTELGLGVAAFVVLVLAATVIGALCGLATAFLTKHSRRIQLWEPALVLGLAYFSYVFAESFGWSGIIALTVCGLVQSHYALDNVAEKSKANIQSTAKALAGLAEAMVFFILGVCAVHHRSIWSCFSGSFALTALLLVLVVRFVVVFALTFVVNSYTDGFRRISFAEQFIMSYGGLRGAIAFALAFMLEPCVTPARNEILTATIVIVLFSVFVQGITVKPLVKHLCIQLHSHTSLLQDINRGVVEHVMSGIDCVTGRWYGSSYLSSLLKRLSQTFLRPKLQAQPHRKGKGLWETARQQIIGGAAEGGVDLLDVSGLVQGPLAGFVRPQHRPTVFQKGFDPDSEEDLLELANLLVRSPDRKLHYTGADHRDHDDEIQQCLDEIANIRRRVMAAAAEAEPKEDEESRA